MYTSFTPSLTFAGWMSFISCGPFLYIEIYNLSITEYAIHQGLLYQSFYYLACPQIQFVNI